MVLLQGHHITDREISGELWHSHGCPLTKATQERGKGRKGASVREGENHTSGKFSRWELAPQCEEDDLL